MKQQRPSPCIGRLGCVIALSFAVQIAHAQIPNVEDVEYGTACGPISCFAALKSLGIDSSLDETIKRCQWVEGKFTPLEDLRDALNSYDGVECELGKISPQQLCEFLKNDQTVVVLAMRKDTDQIDHAVCAVRVDDNGQVIKLFDYPELYRDVLIGDVTSSWDGHALIVRRSAVYRAADKFAYLFIPFVAVLLGVSWLRNRMAPGKASEGDAKPADEKDLH